MDDSDVESNVPGIQNPYPEDTIRIMLATDNHIGYMERDPIRGQDSINTFKEILQLAVKHDVDFILLGGDLFHENKPSRDSLYKTMALLREYTLGDKPVQMELLSDPDEGKAEGFSFPAVNYEDPNLNVSIPVFSIHGNHDDPQGTGADGALCALDVLSVSGLINYMGKCDIPTASSVPSTSTSNTSSLHPSTSSNPTSQNPASNNPNNSTNPSPEEGLSIRPILLRKGNTHLGLYPIGNIKDSRMHFELRSNRVRMYMPRNTMNRRRDGDGHGDGEGVEWFNLLVIHQNRVSHTPQNSVPEGMFDDSIDLVVWGHEHPCRIVPESVPGKTYRITQPGSSVATSLADGEGVEKHVALLQIQGKEYTLTPLPLRTVRPFVIESIVMKEVAEEEGFDVGDVLAIGRCLRGKVNKLIEQANIQWDERNARAVEEGEEELPRMLPLIRLKVDTTGIPSMSNPIRFGQEYQGHIANPRDVLVFHRRPTRSTLSSLNHLLSHPDHPELSIDDPDLDLSASEKLARVRVGTLVREYLSVQELQVLGEGGMGEAIRLFVEKDDVHAIQTHVAKALKTLLKDVQVQAKGAFDEDDVEDMLLKAKEQREKGRKDIEGTEEETKTKTKDKGKSKGKGKGKAKAKSEDEDEDEAEDAPSEDSMAMSVDIPGSGSEFDVDSDAPAPAKKKAAAAAGKKAPAKKAPAKKAVAGKKAPAAKRGRKKVDDSDEDDDVIEIDDDEDEDDDDEPPPPPKRTNRAAVLSQPAKKAPAKKKPAATAASTSKAKQATLNFAPSTRATASRAKAKKIVELSDSDD